MKHLILLIVVVFCGCKDSTETHRRMFMLGNRMDTCYLEDSITWTSYTFIMSDEHGYILYQKEDSATVIVDTMRTIKMLFKINAKLQHDNDSMHHIIDSINYKTKYLTQ